MQPALQLETLNKRRNVSLALGRIILPPHLLALLLEHLLRALRLQQILLLGAIVEEMHAEAHVDGHGLKRLLARLAVYDIVAQVPGVLKVLQRVVGEEGFEPAVRFLVVRGLVQVVFRVFVVLLRLVCDILEGGLHGCEVLAVGVFVDWVAGCHVAGDLRHFTS